MIGRRWDVLTWNRAAGLLFRFHKPYPPHSRNVVWRFFWREEARKFDPDWETQAQNLVAQFRADYARYPGDASFQEIIEDLRRASAQFCVWWERQDVRGLPDGPRTMHHPTLGLLEKARCMNFRIFPTSLSSCSWQHLPLTMTSQADESKLNCYYIRKTLSEAKFTADKLRNGKRRRRREGARLHRLSGSGAAVAYSKLLAN